MAKYFNEPVWAQVVTNIVKGEKGRLGMGFSEIQRELEDKYGIIQSRDNLITKVNRGTFSAQLFLAILKCMDVETINLKELDRMLEREQEKLDKKKS